MDTSLIVTDTLEKQTPNIEKLRRCNVDKVAVIENVKRRK